jgi:pilus assembly protein Flp/PilA
VRCTLTLYPDGTVPSSRAMVTSHRIAPKEFNMVKQFFRMTSLATGTLRADDRGVTSVEYGLMVALIAVAIIGTVIALGGKLNGLFTTIANAL